MRREYLADGVHLITGQCVPHPGPPVFQHGLLTLPSLLVLLAMHVPCLPWLLGQAFVGAQTQVGSDSLYNQTGTGCPPALALP